MHVEFGSSPQYSYGKMISFHFPETCIYPFISLSIEMKFQPSQLPSRKPHFSPRKSSKFAPFIALALLLTVPLYNYPFNIVAEYPSHKYLLSQTVLLEHNNTNLDHDVDDIPCSSGPCNDGGGGGVTLGRREPTGELRLGKGGGKGRVARPREYLERVSTGIKRTKVLEDEKCDLFTGEWVRNPEGPYYTNATCNAIQDHQNCMKYGRPDTGFLKWRWKPDGCDLPIFDPHQFLELVRGKSLAFVGDSVARNHMQSLICLLSRVSYPEDLSGPTDQNKRYQYAEHDFNISMFWSPYLVKTGKLDPNKKRPFDLYLDEFDPHWTTKIALFDYVIISAGHWFFRPTYFYVNNRRIGCLYCPESNISHMTSVFSYRRAFRTAFRAIHDAVNFKGVTFLRTFAPSHFEGGPWDKGGNCVRKRPFKRNETRLKDYSLQMYLIQLEELKIAQRAGRRTGAKFRLFDATKPMLLRPDGHPSKYGNWPVANQTFANDCVHWCLPGPIDSWNDFLHKLLKRENRRS